MPSRIITGASAKLYVNGRPYALVTSYSFTIDYNVEQLRGVDFPLPFELAPGAVSVTGTMSLERLAGKGGSRGAGLTVQVTDVARQQYFSILLIERQTKTAVFKCDFCLSQNESWTVGAKGRMTGNLSLVGIGFSDDSSSAVAI